MAKTKNVSISELMNEYDDTFINSISLKEISNTKELKELLSKLEKANYVVTTFYQTMYNDYMMAINSDSDSVIAPDLDTVKKYKSLASRIQKAYNYIMYMHTFENPFKVAK